MFVLARDVLMVAPGAKPRAAAVDEKRDPAEESMDEVLMAGQRCYPAEDALKYHRPGYD